MGIRRLRRGAILVVLAAALALLTSAPAAGEIRRFRAAGSEAYGWEWQPQLRRIVRGDRIAWINHTNVRHKVFAYGGNWTYDQTLRPHERVRRRFRRVGLYRFRCTIPGHSRLSGGKCTGMCGRVRVRRP